MRMPLLLLTMTLAVGLVMTSSGIPQAAAADKPGKLLRHIVLYKFKDDLKANQVQEVVDAFKALPKKIDLIVAFEAGTNVSTENKSEGLTHAFVVTFRDKKDLDAYIAHPAHQDYVKLVKDRREKVVVFDYFTGE
jgi:hypothetical protein